MNFRLEIQNILRPMGISSTETNKTIFGIATIGLLIGKEELENIAHNHTLIEGKKYIMQEVLSLLQNDEEKKIANLAFNLISSIWENHFFTKITDIIMKFDLEHIIFDLNIFENDFGKDCPLAAVPWINKLVKEIFALHEGKTLYNNDCGTGDFITEMLNSGVVESAIGNTCDYWNLIISEIKAYFLGHKFEVKSDDFFSNSLLPNYVDMIYNSYPLALRYQSKTDIMPMIDSWKIPCTIKKKNSFDLLWIINSLNMLTKDGIIVALVTNGVLYNEIDADLRGFLVDKRYISSIISLPSGILPATIAAVSLIVLQKSNKSNTIRMIDATNICEKQRRYSYFTDENIETIIKLYKSSEESNISFNVSYNDIVKNEYYLGVGRYIKVEYPIINPCALEEITQCIFRGYQIKASELDSISTMNADDTNYRVINVSDIQTDGFVEKNLQAVVIDDVRKFSKYYVEDGDIIITAKNTTIKTAIYREKNYKAILTGNLIAIRVNKEKIDPFYLKAFFDSEIGEVLLNSIRTGTTVFSISPNALKKLEVALPPMEQQKKIANEYQKTVYEIEKIITQHKEKSAYLKQIYTNEIK